MTTFHSTSGSYRRVAVVGAGVAGLACARDLAAAGCAVTVFDKARGPGGRCATRRADSLRFDHGAQYFTARGAAFRKAVASWQAEGAVALWTGRLRAQAADGRREALPDEERFVGRPGMNALGHHLARDLAVRLGAPVVGIERGRGWSVLGEGGAALGTFDAAVLAVPAPQAVLLLSDVPGLAGQAASVVLAPCWATLVSFASPLAAEFDALSVEADEVLAWLARNDSKPGRDPAESWTLHATADWTRTHLEAEPEAIAGPMLARFADLLGRSLPATSFVTAHRWRYALVTKPLGRPFLWDAAARIGVCGDWCIAPRVEAAWQSGSALGRAMLGSEAARRRQAPS